MRAIGAGVVASIVWGALAALAHVPIAPRLLGWVEQLVLPGLTRELAQLPGIAPLVATVTGALLVGVVVMAVALLLRGPARFPGVWLSVPLASLIVSGLLALGTMIGLAPRLGLAFPAADVSQQVGQQAWGLLVGWVPALVAGGTTPALPRRVVAVVGGVVAAALVVVLVTSAAIAAPGRYAPDLPAATPVPSPTITRSPVPLPAPTDIPVPYYALASTDCPPSAFALAQSGGEAAAGMRSFTIEVRNDGTSACTLEGFPGVTFRGADGSPVAAQLAPQSVAVATPAALTLAPGATATSQIRWHAGAEPNDPTLARDIVVRLVTGSPAVAVDSPVLDVASGTVVAVGPWQAGAGG
jgi:hypothetical protein